MSQVRQAARSLRGRNDRSEKAGNRGQIFSILRCIPTSYALRVRSFWGADNDVEQFSDWSFISNIDIFTTGGSCETETPSTLPVPTNLTNPSTGTFGDSFGLSWDDIWTGCGGYEAEFRRAGSAAWTRIEIFSGSSVEINIPLPFGPVDDPTGYALRVRSF